MDKITTDKILEETEKGYNLIANKFSQTRKFFWRDLEFIKDYAKDGDKILDYGCGNGRLLELIGGKNIEYRGVDISQKLIDAASKKYGNDHRKFQKISGSDNLPFPDKFFNVIYSVAVFHHIPSEELRLKIIEDFYRVVKPGGTIAITVWYLWRRKFIKNILKNWFEKLSGKSKLDWNDSCISFKDNRGNIFQRYHHAFTKKELKKLFLEGGFEVKKCVIISRRNIIITGRKNG